MNHLLIYLLIFVSWDSLAGWFDSGSYDGCVLEKMKGSDIRLIEYAEKACEREYPFFRFANKGELQVMKKLTTINWTYTDDSEVIMKIIENESDFKIYEMLVRFSPDLEELEEGAAFVDPFSKKELNESPDESHDNGGLKIEWVVAEDVVRFVFKGGISKAKINTTPEDKYNRMEIISIWGKTKKA